MKTTNKWILLVIASLLMVGFALSLQAVPPLLDMIANDINFSSSEAGVLMGVYAIPGIFLPFIIAEFNRRFNLKILLSTALIIMIIGLISFALSNTFIFLLISRIVMGMGATIIIVLSPLLITMNFDNKSMGVAMGFFNIAVPIGTVVAANIFGKLGSILNWRWVVVIVSIYLAIVLMALFTITLPNKEKQTKETFKVKSIANVSLLALAFIWCFANAQMLAYITFVPKFYRLFDNISKYAGFLTSLIMFVPIFLTPLIGYAFDKTGYKKLYLIIGNIISLVSFLLLATHSISLPVLAFLIGVGFSPVTVFIFAFLPETVKPYEMGFGLGLLSIASNLGTSVGPMGLGYVLDSTSSNFTVAFYILAAFSFINILISFLLKRTNKVI